MADVSLVTLGVRDVEQATRDDEAVGWQRSSMSVDDTISFLSGGTVVLGLFGRDDLATDAAVEFSADGYAPVALAMNLGSRPASTRRSRRPNEPAGRSPSPPRRPIGWPLGACADLDAHLWEIADNPFVPPDDSGRMVLPDG